MSSDADVAGAGYQESVPLLRSYEGGPPVQRKSQ